MLAQLTVRDVAYCEVFEWLMHGRHEPEPQPPEGMHESARLEWLAGRDAAKENRMSENKPVRELRGEEAQRVIRERMMSPDTETLTSIGFKPPESHLVKLRRFQRELRDNDSIEDFLKEHDADTLVNATHMTIAREANRLLRSVTSYRHQINVSRFLRGVNRSADEFPPMLPRDVAGLLGASYGRHRLPLAWAVTTPRGTEVLTFSKLKERTEEGPFTIHLDLEGSPMCGFWTRMRGPMKLSNEPIVLEDIDWMPGAYIQSQSRVRRRVLVNAIALPGPKASRNQREGHYGFKVDGRHTRRHRKPKPVQVLAFDAEVLEKLSQKRNSKSPV